MRCGWWPRCGRRRVSGTARCGRVADQLDVGVESLRTWVRQDEVDAGEAAGSSSADAERIRVLEQEQRGHQRVTRDRVVPGDVGLAATLIVIGRPRLLASLADQPQHLANLGDQLGDGVLGRDGVVEHVEPARAFGAYGDGGRDLAGCDPWAYARLCRSDRDPIPGRNSTGPRRTSCRGVLSVPSKPGQTSPSCEAITYE